MTITEKQQLQIVWEQLNGVISDLITGDVDSTIETLEDCVMQLEELGVGE